jgi:hypothetical protein
MSCGEDGHTAIVKIGGGAPIQLSIEETHSWQVREGMDMGLSLTAVEGAA